MEARKNKIRYGIGIALTIILTIDLLPYLWLLVSSFRASDDPFTSSEPLYDWQLCDDLPERRDDEAFFQLPCGSGGGDRHHHGALAFGGVRVFKILL